jgi:hypothetical protein
VEGLLGIVSLLLRQLCGFGFLAVGTLKCVLPAALPDIMLHPVALIAAGTLMVGGKAAFEQFDVLYRNIRGLAV